MQQPLGESNQIQQAVDRITVISLRGVIVVFLSVAVTVFRLFQR